MKAMGEEAVYLKFICAVVLSTRSSFCLCGLLLGPERSDLEGGKFHLLTSMSLCSTVNTQPVTTNYAK